MKLIVAGGRDYNDAKRGMALLDTIAKYRPITEIVSGGSTGADRMGEVFARISNIPVKVFMADWNTHGRAAGPIRNRQMAKYADAVVLFPGGRGTLSMYNEAKRAGIDIYDFRGPHNQTKAIIG